VRDLWAMWFPSVLDCFEMLFVGQQAACKKTCNSNPVMLSPGDPVLPGVTVET